MRKKMGKGLINIKRNPKSTIPSTPFISDHITHIKMLSKLLSRQAVFASTQIRNYAIKQPAQSSIKQWATEHSPKFVTQLKNQTAQAASTLNKRTGEFLAEGIDVAQHLKHHSDAIHKVRAAQRGYKSLKDKGEKVESEQCRPDDGL